MTEKLNHTNNNHSIGNHLLKWMNVTPSNVKVYEVDILREINGDINFVESKKIYNAQHNNGPYKKITLNKKGQIDTTSQLTLSGGVIVKEYDSYEVTKKILLKEYDSEGTIVSIQESILDGFENVIKRKKENYINNTKIIYDQEASLSKISDHSVIISLNKQSSKIKYYHLGDLISKKIIYKNNKFENSVETFVYNSNYTISNYSKKSLNKNDKSERYESKLYHYNDGKIKEIRTNFEHKYVNSKDETIELYNRFEYNQDGLIITDLFCNVSYNNQERINTQYSYNNNKLISKIECPMGIYNFRYKFDKNGNWVNKVKQFKNKTNNTSEETIRIIRYT